MIYKIQSILKSKRKTMPYSDEQKAHKHKIEFPCFFTRAREIVVRPIPYVSIFMKHLYKIVDFFSKIPLEIGLWLFLFLQNSNTRTLDNRHTNKEVGL